MRAIILAGGYGKRMWPKTKNLPKALLRFKDKLVLNHIIFGCLRKAGVDEILLLTNRHFLPHFERWYKVMKSEFLASNLSFQMVAEPSSCQEEKLGAVGALAWAMPFLDYEAHLIVAGDNIAGGIERLISFFYRKSRPVVAVVKAKTMKEVRNGSSVALNSNNRIVSFEEKPRKPESMLIGACIYALPYETLQKIKPYLKAGGSKDEPGRFIEWLCKKESVYGYELPYVLDVAKRV